MHQPIYYPYESVVETIDQNRYPFSILDVFNSRQGPYVSWPIDSMQAIENANFAHCGAQVYMLIAIN